MDSPGSWSHAMLLWVVAELLVVESFPAAFTPDGGESVCQVTRQNRWPHILSGSYLKSGSSLLMSCISKATRSKQYLLILIFLDSDLAWKKI